MRSTTGSRAPPRNNCLSDIVWCGSSWHEFPMHDPSSMTAVAAVSCFLLQLQAIGLTESVSQTGGTVAGRKHVVILGWFLWANTDG